MTTQPSGAFLRERIGNGTDDLGVEYLAALDVLAHGFARNGRQVRVEQARAGELVHDGGDAARLVELLDVAVARRSEVAEVGRARADGVGLREVELEPALVRDGGQVQHRVRGAAERHVDGERVLERLLRHDVARTDVVPHELHHRKAGLLGEAVARGHDGGNRAVAGQRHAEHLGEAVHGVGREHARAGAAGRTGLVLKLEEGLRIDLARAKAAHALRDVGVGEFAAAGAAREHRAARDHDARDVEAGGGHEQAGHVLVAGGHHHEAVERMRRGHRLDAVGDELARNERILHALVAHRQTVADGDGREDDGHTAAQGDALLHRVRNLVKKDVSRNDVVLRGDDADERALNLRIAETESLKKRALRSRVDAFLEGIRTHVEVSCGELMKRAFEVAVRSFYGSLRSDSDASTRDVLGEKSEESRATSRGAQI